MTLEEAMTDLSIQCEVKRRLEKTHEAESIGLGIEALKQLKLHREVHYKDAIFRLPGETIVDSLSLTEEEK